MRVFVDTNLWVYRLDRREPRKARFVADWMQQLAEEHDLVISTQVLIELRSVLSRKLQPALPAEAVGKVLTALTAFEVISTHANTVLDAHLLAQAHQLAWFDALIAEAALRSHCAILYSEDFSHGQRLGESLLVQNPLHGLANDD